MMLCWHVSAVIAEDRAEALVKGREASIELSLGLLSDLRLLEVRRLLEELVDVRGTTAAGDVDEVNKANDTPLPLDD